jgi:hypothetical protein
MGKKDSKKNNSNRRRSKSISKSLLKTLLGGDDGNVGNVGNVGESAKTPEKKSAFDFFDKFSSPPKDYKAENGADEVKPVSTGLFSGSAAVTAAATASAASGVTDTESSASTGWFVFRVIIVVIIALIFILSMTGYLDDLTAWFTNTFGPYINPILLKLGLMESASNAGDDTANAKATSTANGTTGNVSQLEQNIGTVPEKREDHDNGDNNEPHEQSHNKPREHRNKQEHQEVTNDLKPIPIQPDERQTPLRNKGETARPPATQPASYQEEKSRYEEKQESIQKALEYAEKHPQYPAPDDATSNTQISRSKSGYCYIGEDRGFRSCIQVSPNDKCMSGDIFPSMDVCVYPQFRV